ncbi:uncharacterized protein N7515_005238 [Penicillium bovifimosum]|uniref:Tc1-like transposase DDE domain-containing protein n=1 Tax=Penicillium bovifimosum TaxID=126998 RepID=A0A9W9KZM8_9EURO|nr:uncharacterized protein N7515_005238 [Penicillium bovifimosum]KAJ5129199.1 hypothetical protein N7515_005238 [Penicillium bovifimosum]
MPLRPINLNRVKGTELTPHLRGKISSQAEIGIPTATIARHFGLSPSTIQYTLEQEHARADGKTCPRSGRPPILSEGDKRLILRLIKRDPFIVYREIRDQSGLTASDDTLLRLVKSSGYGHWKARKRPFLTPEVAAPRYKWALAHRNWMWDDWMRVVWSDECSVEIGKGKRHRWVFHLNHTNKKYKKEHVITYRKSKGLSIMIWGAIWGGGSSKIYQMVRDEASARNGYSARSYLDVLEGNLPQILDDTNRIFMQDNAPIHTARLIKSWLDEHEYDVIKWPPYSPDLNPIENAWAKLKEMIDRLDPHLESFAGTPSELKEHFSDLIDRAWEELGQDYFDKLVKTMNHRVAC